MQASLYRLTFLIFFILYSSLIHKTPPQLSQFTLKYHTDKRVWCVYNNYYCLTITLVTIVVESSVLFFFDFHC